MDVQLEPIVDWNAYATEEVAPDVAGLSVRPKKPKGLCDQSHFCYSVWFLRTENGVPWDRLFSWWKKSWPCREGSEWRAMGLFRKTSLSTRWSVGYPQLTLLQNLPGCAYLCQIHSCTLCPGGRGVTFSPRWCLQWLSHDRCSWRTGWQLLAGTGELDFMSFTTQSVEPKLAHTSRFPAYLEESKSSL